MDSDPDLMPAVIELVNIFKDLPRGLSDQIEIEVRLGFIEDEEIRKGHFDPDVSEVNFKKIRDSLRSFPDWAAHTKQVSTDYYQGDTRLTVNKDASRTCMRKVKLTDYDFIYDGCPFDIRISVSQEIPIDPDTFDEDAGCKLTRQKKRETFCVDAWKFDLTEVVTEKDDLGQKSFEVELELDDFWAAAAKNNYNLGWLAHSTFLKVRQLVFMCEKPESEPLMILNDTHYRNNIVIAPLAPSSTGASRDSQRSRPK